MNRALGNRLDMVAALLVVAALSREAWQRIASAVEDGGPSPGMAARVFLPLLLLAVGAVWLGRR